MPFAFDTGGKNRHLNFFHIYTPVQICTFKHSQELDMLNGIGIAIMYRQRQILILIFHFTTNTVYLST